MFVTKSNNTDNETIKKFVFIFSKMTNNLYGESKHESN